MPVQLKLDDTEARAAAEELRILVGDGIHLSRHLRDRMARMLACAGAVEVVAGPRGLEVQPSPEMLSILATLRAQDGQAALA